MSRAQAPSGPRRWPDLLIGLLVVLLLAGFALLLLAQRPRPLAQTPAAPPTVDPAIPGAPGSEIAPVATAPASPPAAAATPDAPQPETAAPTAPPPAAESAVPQPSPEANSPAASSPAPVEVSPPATTPGGEVPAASIPAAPAPPPPPAVTLSVPPANPEVLNSAASTPRPGSAVPTSEERVPLRRDYRISLGTFGSEGLAQTRTAGVRDLGYTVYPIDVGEQVVAQVGPFADEATARQALADIQRAYPGAVLYPPRGRSLSGNTGTSGTSSATAAGSDAAETSPPPTARTPAPSGPMYLQVGAFDRQESAQRLVGQLRDQGYDPIVNAPEGKKVTVLIGPFSGEALTRAEDKLDTGGFDHFRIR